MKGHFEGQYHIGWSSPLAWIQADRVAKARGINARAVAMRDTDMDLTSIVVVPAGSAIQSVADLTGKTVGVGAGDSPQATLIPLNHLAEAGLKPHEEFKVRRFDLLVGKHGDHVGGERDAARAMMQGEVDAITILDANHLGFIADGTLPQDGTVILDQTAPFDHCNFTVLDDGRTPTETVDRFVELILGMSYDDPEVRPLLDLEGLKVWKPGRVEGYAQLERAVDRFGYLDAFMAEMSGGDAA